MRVFSLLISAVCFNLSVFGMRVFPGLSKIMMIPRGGHLTSMHPPTKASNGETYSDHAFDVQSNVEKPSNNNIKIIILANTGSPHLDFKTRFYCSKNDTIGHIKKQIETKMHGNPPPSLQRLIFGLRELDDEETIASILPDTIGTLELGKANGDKNVHELALLLDMLPPLASTKSVPVALEAKLKAYAAELIAINHLTKQLSEFSKVPVGISVDNSIRNAAGSGVTSEDISGSEESLVLPSLVTDVLNKEIKAMEATLFDLLKPNLDAKKLTIYSAILEDGLIDESALVIGPWLELQHRFRHHLDIDIKETLKKVSMVLLMAKFGTYGNNERMITNMLVLGYLVAQTRFVRPMTKILFSLAASDRNSPFVELLSTFLPISQQAILDAEVEAYRQIQSSSKVTTNDDDDDEFSSDGSMGGEGVFGHIMEKGFFSIDNMLLEMEELKNIGKYQVVSYLKQLSNDSTNYDDDDDNDYEVDDYDVIDDDYDH